MNFLETPEGGLIASGLIVNVVPRDDSSVECFDRNGQSLLLIGAYGYERQVLTLSIIKQWVREGKRAKQPDWRYLTDDDIFDKMMAKFTEPKRA